MDIPVEIGLKRASDRSAPDRFEQEQVEFFERVRQGYLNTAGKDPQRYAVIDASQSLDGVQFDIKAAMETFLATTKVRV